jgi:hypothetical protein
MCYGNIINGEMEVALCHNAEDHNWHLHGHENLKYQMCKEELKGEALMACF